MNTSRTITALRVLVVEDHVDSADSIAMLLGLDGHAVRVARTGPEALESVDVERPDVVLLDIGLPGMNGYDVARELRGRQTGKVPFVVAVTGYGREEDRRMSAEAGIDLHLVKPIDPEKLLAILNRFEEEARKRTARRE